MGDGLLGSARGVGGMAAADGDAWLNGVENVENAVEAESTLAQVWMREIFLLYLGGFEC